METKTIINTKPLFHSFYKKTLFLTILFFGMGLIYSCHRPGSHSEDIYYNSLETKGINNTGKWGIYVDYNDTIDTLYSDAAVIAIRLMDSVHYFSPENSNNNMYIKMSPAPMVFYPVDKVVDIKFYTVFEINNTFLSGDNISDSILYLSDNNLYTLYQAQFQAIKYLNSKQTKAFPTIFAIVMPSIKNSKARFITEVILDNGEKLSDTTKTFTVIPSYP